MKKIVKTILKAMGYRIEKIKKNDYPIDIPREIVDLYENVSPYTATSIERVAALADSVKYVTENNVNGDFVECGVWKGIYLVFFQILLASSKGFQRNQSN